MVLWTARLKRFVKTIQNSSASGFNIADWVGNLKNESATVGDGTIVHSGSKEAKATSFGIEFNNSTVSGNKGLSVTLGEGDNAVTLELSGTEIKAGDDAKSIVSAFVDKYGKDGVEFTGADGSKVKFDVSASESGTRLNLVQAEKPTDEGKVVNSSMALTYNGIGKPKDNGPRLNNTAPEVSFNPKKNNAHIAGSGTGETMPELEWAAGVKDKVKDALNTALADGVEIKVQTKADGTTAANVDSHKIDLSGLKEALGDEFDIYVRSGGTDFATAEATDPMEANAKSGSIYEIDKAKNFVSISIRTKSGEDVGKLNLQLAGASGGLGAITNAAGDTLVAANTNTGATLTTTIKLDAGNNQSMNTAPIINVKDDGGFEVDGTPLLQINSNLTEEELDELNKFLTEKDASIKLNISDLNGNVAQSSSVVKVELSKDLVDKGYYIATGTTNPSTTDKYDEEDGATVAAAETGALKAKYEISMDGLAFTAGQTFT